MAKQDDFIRLTLRLPPALHEMLVEAAGPRSLNAEIIDRLESSILDEQLGRTKSLETLLQSVAKVAARQAVRAIWESWDAFQNLPPNERDEFIREGQPKEDEPNM